MPARDLLQPGHTADGPPTPTLMRGTIVSADGTGRTRVSIPELDGGRHALDAFGHFPDAAPDDAVRVMLDDTNRVVIVAWEPTL